VGLNVGSWVGNDVEKGVEFPIGGDDGLRVGFVVGSRVGEEVEISVGALVA